MANKDFGKRAEMGRMMRGEETMAPSMACTCEIYGQHNSGQVLIVSPMEAWMADSHAEDIEDTLADTLWIKNSLPPNLKLMRFGYKAVIILMSLLAE